jgi:hypothetical protein
VVGGAFGLDLSAGVAQVVTHLRIQGAFDERSFEILEDILELLFGHRTGYELFK